MDNALSFLGICKKAGKLLTGEDGVAGAARGGDAVLIMTAADTAANTKKRALNLGEWHHVQQVSLPWNKDTLGELLDKRVCAILAITDKGLAAAFLEKLAAQDPTYGAAAELFHEKAARKGRKVYDEISRT